ncbi:putative autophagy-related protein 11 [Euwallacea fornicatus]|uniref:putative autophagy-related protein 11 n=1 Tax=Euwallacea fornicatus TaxID=995702 RepID=UPI0033903F7A
MSFSKAKIIRFNDVTVKGASSSTSNSTKDKLSEKPKKASSCTGNLSPGTSEHGSVKSAPGNFKTPTLPKKSKTATPATKPKPKDLFKTDLEALKEKTEECEQKTKYIHQLTEELEQCKKDLENVNLEKEQIQRENQNELQSLEFEMLQTMTKLQKQEEDAAIRIKQIENKLDSEVQQVKKANEYHMGQLVLDYEIKIKDLKESSERRKKSEFEELENEWKKRLQKKEEEHEAILKECQAISEYSIISCELEKKEVQMHLDETKAIYQELKLKYETLNSKQENAEKSLTDKEEGLSRKVKELSEIIDKQEEEVQKLKVEIKAYQITINNSQITIDVLKKRLIDSDRDVEQMKQELARCEGKLIDYEGKCIQLDNELSEAKKQNEDLELQYESSIKINENSIKLMKEQLINKVDWYENQVKIFSNKATEEQDVKQQILQQLNCNIEIIKQINLEVDKTEEYYALKIKDLMEVIDSYERKEQIWSEKLDAVNLEKKNLTIALNAKESRNLLLEDKLQELKNDYGELSEKCVYYKAKAEEFESMAKESSQTRKMYIDISGKYDSLLQDFEQLEMENRDRNADLLGMNKKLQRLLNVEQEFERVKKEKEMLESEKAFYKTKLDEQKLKKYKIASKDKENIGSPNRSLIESPNRGSPFRASPFRERNN